MDAAHLELDQEVEIREEDGRIILSPVAYIRYDMDGLVAGITEENKHDLVDLGEPVGQEVW